MSCSIWKWFYVGFCINQMVIFNSKFLLFYCLFGFLSYFSKSQKLFVPVEDNEIIFIPKEKKKMMDLTYQEIQKEILGLKVNLIN